MFLKNKNIIFKIRRSKVTDYAALNQCISRFLQKLLSQNYRHIDYNHEKVPTESKLIYAILSITNDIASSKIYDKRDYFNFETINFPFLEGDDPRSLPMMYP